jgi:hypothetical protein
VTWREEGQTEQERMAARGRSTAYEYLRREQEGRQFDTGLSVTEQRDELLAFAGMMVDWGLRAVDAVRDETGEDYFLMRDALRAAGERYGPWRR